MKGNYYSFDGKPISKEEYYKFIGKIPKDIKYFRVEYNEFREDIQRWEQKVQFLKYFHYYRYKIWKNGKTEIFYRLWRYKSKTAKLIYCIPLQKTKINCQEFHEKYKGNKHLVPTDFILDCNES